MGCGVWRLWLLGVLVLCVGCVSTPAMPEPETQVIHPALVHAVVRRSPVGTAEAFTAEPLLEAAAFSMHVLQYRTREARHIHFHHDLTTMIHAGEGELYIDDRRYLASAGDVFHIPRGTAHYAVNTGDEPLVAVLVFVPAFDGEDSVEVERGSRSYERGGSRGR